MFSDRESSTELVSVARQYCRLIERVAGSDNHMDVTTWLQQIQRLLPRIHAAVSMLGRDQEIDYSPPGDMEQRFEIYARLHDLLGQQDSYWMEFDVSSEGQGQSGSLADDLTDIYCDLREGLRHMESSPPDLKAALHDWNCGFHLHWGRHLLDAERHLYDLFVTRTLRT